MHLNRQPNGKWRVQVRRKIGGEYIQKSKVFDDKREAEAWGYLMEASMNDATMTIGQALEQYKREVIDPELETKTTVPGRRSHGLRVSLCNKVMSIYGNYPLETFGPVQLNEVIKERLNTVSKRTGRKLTPSTVRKEVYFLSGFYEWLRKDKFMTDLENPCRGVRIPEDSPYREYVHKPEHQSRLLAELNGEPAAVYELLLLTACRLSEIVYLQIEWVDMKRRVITLPQDVTKTKKPRTVPLPTRAVEIISEVARGRRVGRLFSMTYDGIRQSFVRARRRAGLDHLRLHDCRHTRTTELVKKMPTLAHVARITGHSNVQTLVKRYTHLEAEDLHPYLD